MSGPTLIPIESAAEESKFPVKTSTHVLENFSENTPKIDLVISHYSDHLFVLITETSKPGSIFQVKRSLVEKKSDHLYDVNLLLGVESEELILTARILAQTLNVDKPLIVCLGLKEPENKLKPQFVRQLVDAVKSKLA